MTRRSRKERDLEQAAQDAQRAEHAPTQDAPTPATQEHAARLRSALQRAGDARRRAAARTRKSKRA